jgi:TolB-like protein/DNA-binding winged helix-turn-helix (wHTH) protein/tetratricopeptide (TPR) repeat protein
MLGESRVLRIGDWRVDPELDELSREGRTVRVEPRTMQLLLYLAAHAGRVIDVQQLLDAVWSNVVVTQGSVYQAVAELRRILGDDREHPAYIENLPRRGYRLIAPVAPWNARNSAAPSDSTAIGSSPMTSAPIPAEVQSVRASPDRLAYMGTETVAAARPLAPRRLRRSAVLGGIALAAVIVAGIALDAFWRVHHMPVTGVRVAGKTEVPVTPVTFAPPPHSIAVLPFVNMSGDPSQEYFSDGLTEELLNSLSRINELQVAARTSAFSFKGKDTDISTIARKLNVASVLEGSVRRSGHTIRVTAQLNNAVTGYHIWSQTYDRELGDVLKLQTEMASAVASALEVTLLQDVAADVKVGGTRNPAAYDAYLRSTSAYWQVLSASDNESVRAGYQEAVRLDPNFALAYAGWSIALTAYASLFAHGPAVGDFSRQAGVAALKAVALAPELAEGHLALALVQQQSLDFAGASDEFQRAMTLTPGNARILRDYGAFAVAIGRTDAGLTAARRAVALDPLNENSYGFLSSALLSARRYDEALAAYQNWLSLRPKDPQWSAGNAQLIYYALGDFEKMRAICEGVGEAVKDSFQDCLALAYHKLARQADAETALARFKALKGNAGAYGYATIYAQWGNRPKALEWLDTAMRWRDPDLINLKTDPLMDPLRQEPRFQAIERELKFPK